MAVSRKISDCDNRLEKAWNQAVAYWNNRNGLIPFITCSSRDAAEQAIDYEKGRSIPNGHISPQNPMGQIVTRAKAYQSPHNFTPAQAFDFAFERKVGNHFEAVWNDAQSYSDFRALILKADPTLISGATFKGIVDADHIETPDWKTNFKNLIPQ